MRALLIALIATATVACRAAPQSSQSAPPRSFPPAAVYRRTVEVSAFYRLDGGVPVGVKVTDGERRIIKRVNAELNRSARRDLAVAFVPSPGGRKDIVVFVEPRTGLLPSAGRRSLGECIVRPGCRHYCAWYYVPNMNSLSVSTLLENRCADGEPIWRRG